MKTNICFLTTICSRETPAESQRRGGGEVERNAPLACGRMDCFVVD